MNIEKLKYPIGKFSRPADIRQEQIQAWIDDIEALPANLRKLLDGISEEELGTTYRPDGWTIRQVVHHLADSHINSYVRLKWTLTEDKPTIKAYYEQRWAELPEAKNAPIEMSLDLLDAIHYRWVVVLKALTEQDFRRSFIHPETGNEVSLDENIGLYAWHCNHHFAHINNCLDNIRN